MSELRNFVLHVYVCTCLPFQGPRLLDRKILVHHQRHTALLQPQSPPQDRIKMVRIDFIRLMRYVT